MKNKNWITLNAHGKDCLQNYLFALSTNDVFQSKMDYLHRKGITEYASAHESTKRYREPRACDCLSDIGIETAAHYFPKYTNWETVRQMAKSIFADYDYPSK
jgi:hypothetical protein